MRALMSTLSFSTTDLTQLHRQLDRWRGRQPGREQLPGPLWEEAAQLARERSVSEVARRPRIDFYHEQGTRTRDRRVKKHNSQNNYHVLL